MKMRVFIVTVTQNDVNNVNPTGNERDNRSPENGDADEKIRES